jgi:hypothetical protein
LNGRNGREAEPAILADSGLSGFGLSGRDSCRLRTSSLDGVTRPLLVLLLKGRWLGHYAAFAIAFGILASTAEAASTAIGERPPILSPEKDEAMLRDAGFDGVALFYAGFSFRGWVAYKA